MDDLISKIRNSLRNVPMDDLAKERFLNFVSNLKKISKKPVDDLLLKFSEEVLKAAQNPHSFEPYHARVTSPF